MSAFSCHIVSYSDLSFEPGWRPLVVRPSFANPHIGAYLVGFAVCLHDRAVRDYDAT